MADIRKVTDDFAVAPQIGVGDVAAAARAGYALLINNRPDGEAPDQPTSEQMAEAACDAGLAYVHIPVRGGPTLEQVEAMQAALAQTKGPALAFCRSGTRSIVTWALGEARTGTLSREALLRLGAQAGYDLSAVLSR
jgi:uncharacterized protein (TIGR01244 family)